MIYTAQLPGGRAMVRLSPYAGPAPDRNAALTGTNTPTTCTVPIRRAQVPSSRPAPAGAGGGEPVCRRGVAGVGVRAGPGAGVRLGVGLESDPHTDPHPAGNGQVNGPSAVSRNAATDHHLVGVSPGEMTPMGRSDPLLAVQAALTHRDHRLLGWLYDHGVLTTEQIAHALFGSLDFAQRRLLKLTGYGVIDRFRPQRPDGGSYPYHYVIDQLGAEVVAAQRRHERPRRDHARRRRHHLTPRANLTHLLGVNRFFTDLAGHARTHPGSELSRWWPASRFHHASGFLPDGDAPPLILASTPRPDGHGIWHEYDTRVPFYLEYDLGTEPLDVLLSK